MSEIPIISLNQERGELISSIRNACLTHGFFQITSFNDTYSTQVRLMEYMHIFFQLPDETKDSLAKEDSIHGGYERFQKYSLQTSRGKPDLNEGYCIAPEFVDAEKSAWPEETAENGLRGFRATCREYFAGVEKLGRLLSSLIAEGLGLSPRYFDEFFETQMSHCRLIHYYVDREQSLENKIGAGLHSDWGLITILLQDDVGGLEIFDQTTHKFIQVPPTPGAFVINCGDLLSRLTNNVYTSAKHRVVAPPPGVHRYSIPHFCDGNPAYNVDVLPLGSEWKEWVQGKRGTAPEVKRLYQPIKAGEYFEKKWRESTDGGRGHTAGSQ